MVVSMTFSCSYCFMSSGKMPNHTLTLGKYLNPLKMYRILFKETKGHEVNLKKSKPEPKLSTRNLMHIQKHKRSRTGQLAPICLWCSRFLLILEIGILNFRVPLGSIRNKGGRVRFLSLWNISEYRIWVKIEASPTDKNEKNKIMGKGMLCCGEYRKPVIVVVIYWSVAVLLGLQICSLLILMLLIIVHSLKTNVNSSEDSAKNLSCKYKYLKYLT